MMDQPESTGQTELDKKVDEAVAIIQNGQGAPMKAIGMLLDVLKENPDHEKALLWLGNFSMMSGQWDKAVDRFHHLSQLHPEVEIYTVNKVESLLAMGDTTSAVTAATNYVQAYPDAKRVAELASELQH
jgi:TolA-binding protein